MPENNASTASTIREILSKELGATHIEIIDESHLHAGHKAAKGGGHFVVKVVSPQFEGKSLVERHQAVYGALGSQMKSGEIHALSLKTLSTNEWKLPER